MIRVINVKPDRTWATPVTGIIQYLTIHVCCILTTNIRFLWEYIYIDIEPLYKMENKHTILSF